MSVLTGIRARLAALRRPGSAAGLGAGDRHYRAYVGPPEDFDLIGALQFSLLTALGLREQHRLLDVGCGSLRAGRLFIPYLLPERYFGIEPNAWLVKDGLKRELGRSIAKVKRPRFAYNADFDASGFGVEFDWILAHSVFSHTYADLASVAVDRLSRVLGPGGIVVGTFLQGPGVSGSGWLYPGCTTFSREQLEGLFASRDLVVRSIAWPHPRQSWFAAARNVDEKAVDVAIERLGGLTRPTAAET